MKIAIISDIHGNLEALRATIQDIEKRNVEWPMEIPKKYFLILFLRIY